MTRIYLSLSLNNSEQTIGTLERPQLVKGTAYPTNLCFPSPFIGILTRKIFFFKFVSFFVLKSNQSSHFKSGSLQGLPFELFSRAP